MDSATGQINKGKIIGLSILAGIGCAIVGFLAGTVVTFVLLNDYFGSPDMGIMIAVVVSPIIGVLTAILPGILGGWWLYRRLSAKQS